MSENLTTAYKLPAITLEQYSAAVLKLLDRALANGGGSTRAAAEVLLGTYNGAEFHMDLVDLCLLDPEHFAAAMAVLHGRVVINMEPHQVIKDGDKWLLRVWDRWEHLHVMKRYLGESS